MVNPESKGLLTFSEFMYGYLIPIICVCGITGNVMSLFVLLNEKMRSVVNTLLAGLSFCDSMFLLFAIVVYSPLVHCPCVIGFCEQLL